MFSHQEVIADPTDQGPGYTVALAGRAGAERKERGTRNEAVGIAGGMSAVCF